MKKTAIFSTAALLLAATAGALAFAGSSSPDLTARTRLADAGKLKTNANRAPSRASAGYDLWIADVQSHFGEDTNFSYDAGPMREYSAEISLTGNKAKIKGLFDLWYDDIDKEYILEGTYDQRAGTITIPVAMYDSENYGIEGYTKAAEMHSQVDNRPYTLVLFAGNMDQAGTLNTIKDLVFSISDDMDKITSRTGFGLYAFDAQGNPMAFYDFYKTCNLSIPADGVKLSTTSPEINFSGQYITTGTDHKAVVNLLNRGHDDADVTVSSTSGQLSVKNPNVKIASGERKSLEICLNPSLVGRLDEDILVTPDNGDPLKIHVGVEVHVRPDYTLITKAESAPLGYAMSPYAPFVIEEINGQTVAVSINEGNDTESWFQVVADVPSGQTGLFTFKGMQENKQPNGMVVYLDGEQVMNYSYSVTTYQPYPTDGLLVLPAGKHLITFLHYMPMDHFESSGVHGRCYVHDLNLQLCDTSEATAALDRQSIVFEEAYFDSMATTRSAEVRLYNLSQKELKVTGCDAAGGFSANASSSPVGFGQFVDIPITWTVSAVGKAEGSVTIHSTLGDYTVTCEGTAKEIPAEYQKIVSKGKFSFDTDNTFPFIYQTAREYLYNSSSKSDSNDISNSWIEATFEVPEGSLGKLSWDASNDSEDLFYYLGIPSVISGTTITLDGEHERSIGGLSANCGSANIYTPGELIFEAGTHKVKFNYKKTFSIEKYVYGDDRLKLYDLALEIINLDEKKGQVVPESCNFKGMPYSVERDGHQTVGIVNYTSETCKLISWDAEGPFSVVDLSEFAYENVTPFMIEYHPTKTGVETGSVTLHTTIGDYTVECSASGVDLNRGGRVWYESFEYDIDGWLFEDFDADGMGWMDISTLLSERSQEGGFIFGYRGLGVQTYDYANLSQFGTEMDNVMFSPEIEIPAEGTTLLQFLVFAKSWDSDLLEVYVGEDADTYLDLYDKVYEREFTNGLTPWTELMVDVSEYAGKTIRFAFRHYNPCAGNTYYLAIDDILVTNSEVPSVSGIRNLKAPSAGIEEISYCSLDGKRLSAPGNGICIKSVRHSDGTVTNEKIVSK